jgi:hypothetical protein
MKTRSSANWNTLGGTIDSLNINYIDFDGDYPEIGNNYEVKDFEVAIANNYKTINEKSLVSMFIDDYLLERFWKSPLRYAEMFGIAKYVMSPDYSLLVGMPTAMQQWNVYRNRMVGYIWQSREIKVIPTISWSDYSSFEYCFKGIKEESVVAISNTGCRKEEQKKYFDDGLNELIRSVKPSKILFQCNKRFRDSYKSNKFIFLESYWDKKRTNGR